MPEARVSFIHMRASAADLWTLRHRTAPVDQAPVTFVAILPDCTAAQTRPCCAQPQIGVSSPPRPWLSHWNHSHTFPSSTRLAVERIPPPRLAKKKLDGCFSLAMPSYSFHNVIVR